VGGGYGGGSGDRTQGAGNFGGNDVNQPSSGDQYGSSGGYGGSDPSGNQQGQGQNQNQQPNQQPSQQQGQHNQNQNQNQSQQQGSGGTEDTYVREGLSFAAQKAGYNIDQGTEDKIAQGVEEGLSKFGGGRFGL